LTKPGITGWAQVNGYRGEISIWYIENRKFSLDIRIILQTVINIVKGEEKAF
jgi:lipopolysaccharide/colanic/teichoic acid biosynthesis glycosyltransferase